MRSFRPSHTVSAAAIGAILLTRQAVAEKMLFASHDVEVFSDGRVGSFLSYTHGNGLPRPTYDANGNVIYNIEGGGLSGLAERQSFGSNGQLTQGTLDGVRVRSGFIGNIFGIGVRSKMLGTIVSAYIQFFSIVESNARRMVQPNPIDVRQGYAKLESTWGNLLAGRTRSLFSRGATDIDALYGHGYGLGFPGSVDFGGPSAGHIGFGVIGAGEAAGVVYEAPSTHGFQVTLGIYDPFQVEGAWRRTKWPRPEGELTLERPIAAAGKIVLFANGAYQDVHDDNDEHTSIWGVGYGGRVEIGPARLGAAGHYGRGVGLDYAFETTDATFSGANDLRSFEGYYLQSQVVLGSVDLSAGWGVTRVHLAPTDSVVGSNGYLPHSVLKRQMGVSAGVVYHVRPWLHLDWDVFHADMEWFLGERQVVNTFNGGVIMTW